MEKSLERRIDQASMNKRFLRIISFILITALFITSCRFDVFAIDEEQLTAMSVTETKPEGQATDTESFVVENTCKENSAEQEGETSSENIIKIDDEKPAEEQKPEADDWASPSNAETVELISDPIDGVLVSVIAPVGTLPEGATLSVKKVESTDDAIKDIDAAVDNTQLVEGAQSQAYGGADNWIDELSAGSTDGQEMGPENESVDESATSSEIDTSHKVIRNKRYSFDIKIFDDDNEEVQPLDTVQVKFTHVDETVEVIGAKVYHLEENTIFKKAFQQNMLNKALSGSVYSDEETLVTFADDGYSDMDGDIVDDLDDGSADDPDNVDVTDSVADTTKDTVNATLKESSLYARELETSINQGEKLEITVETEGFSFYTLDMALMAADDSNYVAEVLSSTGAHKAWCETLSAAFTAANTDGDVIVILRSFTAAESSAFTVGNNLKLSLGSNVVTLENGDAYFNVDMGYEFTIDSSSNGGIRFLGSTSTVQCIEVSFFSVLQINGGEYISERDAYLIQIEDFATADIYNAHVQGVGEYVCSNSNLLRIYGADTLIEGGTIAAINNIGSIYIYNGKISGINGVENGANGILEMNDGVILASGVGIDGMLSRKITINKGTITATTSAIVCSSDLEVVDGEFSGSVAIDVTGGEAIIRGGTIHGIKGASQTPAAGTEPAGVYCRRGAELIIYGGTITGLYAGVYNRGELTIDGEEVSISGVFGLATYGKAELTGCRIEGYAYGVLVYYCNLTSNCRVFGGDVGIWNEGDISITGGTITATNPDGTGIRNCDKSKRNLSCSISGDVVVSGSGASLDFYQKPLYSHQIYINGGIFENSVVIKQSFGVNPMTVEINDGVFKAQAGAQYAIDVKVTNLTINGGRFDETINASKMDGTGAFIYGGFFQPDDIIDDNDSRVTPKRLAPNKIVVPATVDSNQYHWVIDDAEAIIYAQWTFGTLEEMMATASAESEVLVRRDVSWPNKNYSFAHNGAILNLNGFDVNCASMNTNLSVIKDKAESGAKGVLTVADRLTVDPDNYLESDPNDVYIPVYDSNTQDYDGKTGYKFFRFAADERDASEYTASATASDSQIAGFPFVMQFLDTEGDPDYDSEAYQLLQGDGHGGIILKSVVEWNSRKYLFDYTNTGLLQAYGLKQHNNNRLQRISLYYKVPKEDVPITATIRIQSSTGFDRKIGPITFSEWSQAS